MKFLFINLMIVVLILTTHCNKSTVKKTSDKVHTFYYAWYGNPKNDGKYRHWNHQILPHWSNKKWDSAGSFSGKNKNIGANFFPKLGTYSSKDTLVIKQHMRWMVEAGIGVFVMSWWGSKSEEANFTSVYLNMAEKYGLKMAFHIEPFYEDPASFRKNLRYLNKNYGNHPAIFRWKGKPFYYIYDSYKLKAHQWASLLKPNGKMTVRGTENDGIFIGLWVHKNEGAFFTSGGFDGFYTYFASDGFVYGSTTKNWKTLSNFAKANELIFIPCAGPGYLDTRIRPWNNENTKNRNGGLYYEKMFLSAIKSKPNFIGITSFNEWHEGTQIEPAIATHTKKYHYENYGKNKTPLYYIKKTKKLIGIFEKQPD